MTAKDHYEKHLARYYAWMLGDFQEKMEEQKATFLKHGLRTGKGSQAIDLGAGTGIQSVALAALGYNVTAVDFNSQLLQELRLNARSLSVRTVEDDMISFLSGLSSRAELMVCMGDTLTHLANRKGVDQLFHGISAGLRDEGRIVISFRELVEERKGIDRFLLLRSNDTRIVSCFLEYFADHVMVHDIIDERESGKWVRRISAYPKLRLSAAEVITMLSAHNIAITSTEVVAGMVSLYGQKVPS